MKQLLARDVRRSASLSLTLGPSPEGRGKHTGAPSPSPSGRGVGVRETVANSAPHPNLNPPHVRFIARGSRTARWKH